VVLHRGREISEFKASLVYRVSSRTARATQRNPVSKHRKKKRKKEKRKREGDEAQPLSPASALFFSVAGQGGWC
jgi:hypothetical protein